MGSACLHQYSSFGAKGNGQGKSPKSLTVLVVYVVVETGKKAAIRKRNIYEEAQQQRVLYVVAYSNILLCHL